MCPDRPPAARTSRIRLTTLALAAVSLLSSLAFVLAPVDRPAATYGWPATAGDPAAVAVPLMLYLPERLVAEVGCADARRAGEDGVELLATTPADAAPRPGLRPGLSVRVADGSLDVTVGPETLDRQPVPADGACVWTLTSTVTSTTLSRDGEVLQQVDGDVRPTVAGVFSRLGDVDDSSVQVTADTVFQTSPTVLKTGLGVLAVLSLLGALVCVARADRHRPDAPARIERPRRPRGVWALDAVVALAIALWTAIGPMTIDDGYITGIVAGRDANGYVSDVYRWFNAPEAPFGWFYELLGLWSRISPSTVWMRVPSAVLGVVAWLVLSRSVLPRLGAAGAGAGRQAVAAVVFGAWWLPFGVGLRPEAWVVTGLVVVVVLVERGLERRTVLPLVAGLVVAGATLAVTPTGAVAFLVYLAAVVPLLRLCRARTDLGWTALAVLALAAAATTALFVFADQNLAAIRLANQIRTDLPGALEWSEEVERYAVLLTAGDVQGPIARRVPVLLTLLAVAGIGWRLRRSAGDAVPRPFVVRLLVGFGLSLVLLVFTPTKWTLHFGAFAATGTAIVLVALHLFSRRAMAAESAADRWDGRVPVSWVRTYGVAATAVAGVAALSYAGWNQWAYLSDLDVPFNDIPPEVRGIRLSTLALIAAIVLAVGAAAVGVWAAVRDQTEVRLPLARRLPSPAALAVALMAVTVALQLGSFVKAGAERRDTYSQATDTLEALSGRPCGMAERLSVETDPTRGLLPAAEVGEEEAADGFGPAGDGDLRRSGTELAGWAAAGHSNEAGDGPATVTTGWFALDPALRDGDLPLTVTVRGGLEAGASLVAELGRRDGADVEVLGREDFVDPGESRTRELRLDPRTIAGAADLVRLVAEDGRTGTARPLAFSGPRVPVTTPLGDVVPADEPALVDWPVAFVFPCQEHAVQALGLTDVPRWRIAAPLPNTAGDIITSAAVGGPYAPAALLVDQVEYPVYQDGAPIERPVTLYRWVPRQPLEAPARTVADQVVAGWAG